MLSSSPPEFHMSARIEPLMTVDHLEAMPEDGNRYEVIEGELFVSCAPGLTHQIVSGNIHHIFSSYLDEHPMGTIVATPGLMLDLYSGVVPDLVFFTHERGRVIVAKEKLHAAPELVIEIVSPGRPNIERDRVAKFQLYAKHGVIEYWIVDSENQALEVYKSTEKSFGPASIFKGEKLVISAVLPELNYSAESFFKNTVR